MCDELAALIPKENLPHFWGGPVQARTSNPISSTGGLLLGICLPLPTNHRNFIEFQSENSDFDCSNTGLCAVRHRRDDRCRWSGHEERECWGEERPEVRRWSGLGFRV